MTVAEYARYDEEEILGLYSGAGWSAYTADPDALREGFENSLLVLAAYDGGRLAGIARAVGDGRTIVYVQDVLVREEYRRRGVGTALMKEILQRYAHVRQIVLVTDDTPDTAAFYESLGFGELSRTGCRGYMRIGPARRCRYP